MKSRRLLPLQIAAFSMVEVMVACGLLGIASAASVGALIRMNHNAALSRLQTGASTIAQNRIDQFLSDRPFNPKKSLIPPTVEPGTNYTGSEANPTLAVYTDPATGSTSVGGWMTTTVTNTNTFVGGGDLHVYSIAVNVFYKYRGKTYQVAMSSARSPDE